uniref:Uncharacterized protein n=1 Tax=Cajanus cajan TaxID=3821 RepID=A0A151U3X5_CAJCA|nr:hypothetical protein KK1_006663 [Cajanus cajan]
MELPTTNNKIEPVKEEGPLFHCDFCDTEVVQKLALPGLASTCVDNTTGDPFKTPGLVAVHLRKEMVEYVTQKSESFVAEFVILEGGPEGETLEHSFDIISHFVGEFNSKRNLLSQFSGWLLSDKRESIMRREMDRHCITVCSMKLVNCPFYAVGCRYSNAQSMIRKHCSDDVESH